MAEMNAHAGVKRDLTAVEQANLKVLQKIRPSIVKIVNAVLVSHGLDVVLTRIDFADATSRLAGEFDDDCAMCCCAAGFYSCCTTCRK